MADDVILVFTTVPDAATARRIAAAILANRVAACVNMMAPCTSIYHWEGQLEESSEVPLLIKSTGRCYAALEQMISAEHPYRVPEIVAVPIQSGLESYLDWIASEVFPGGAVA